ncbi:MAG: tetratricopeptide repeat protein [bacterium]
MKQWIFIFCLFILPVSDSYADETESLFYQGNKLYENGDYSGAVDFYERILASGKQSWQLYYNLGNAYYKLNKTGMSILNYERAYKLDPENEDIRFNLQLANLAIVDRIPEPPKAEWMIWLENIQFSLSFSALVWMTLSFYAIFMLSLALKYMKPELWKNRVIRFFGKASVSVFIIFFLWFAYRWYQVETEQFAIVLQSEVSVSSSPTQDATEVFALHEGTKLKIEQHSGEWVRIRLQDGKVGWLPVHAVGMI